MSARREDNVRRRDNDPHREFNRMITDLTPVGNGLYAIDTHYVRPRMDASHLIVDSGQAAFVDTGVSASVPRLLAALAALDVDPAAVEYVVITHVHLDHAGGVGQLLEALPRARVVVHPRGAAHLADPSRLAAATRAVYGAERFESLYGELRAVAPERLVPADEGLRIRIGARSLEFLHTPGHALHHLCAFDRDARAIFSGDTFGVSYRDLDTDAGAFIVATTTPTQFDPAQLRTSIDRLLALAPRAIYLTHYSRIDEVERLGADLQADVAAMAAIAQAHACAPDRVERLGERIFDHWSRRLDAHGFTADAARRHALLDGDAALNAAGLDAWLSRTSP
jgi:glyoxylase-like metal-dependent hydrolase (beta-lactamase superfamily II)